MLNSSVITAITKSKSKRKIKENERAEREREKEREREREREEKDAGFSDSSDCSGSKDKDKDEDEGGGEDGSGGEESGAKSRSAVMSIERSISMADELYTEFFLPSKISRHSFVQERDVPFRIGLAEKVFLVLDDPQCCGLAKFVSIFMMSVIVLSCVIYVISTDASLRHTPSSCEKPACDNDVDLCPGRVVCEPVPPDVFNTIEVFCIVLFTMDYGLRVLLVMFMPPRVAGVLTSKEEELALTDALQRVQGEKESVIDSGKEQKESALVAASREELEQARVLCEDPELSPPLVLLRYMTQVMNIIDVVAIVPFYIELATSSGSSIAIVRVLRLARMLRIFKASKYNEGTKLLSQTIWRSLPALSLLFFFTALGVVLFGSLIYFMEGGKYEVTAEYPDGAYLRNDLVGVSEVTPYTSIPVACYWVIVTATTVGFGDLYPTSGGGRLVACICMYIGLLVLALPITVVGSNFTMVYEEKQEIEDEKERLQALRDGGSANGEKDIKDHQRSITALAELGLEDIELTETNLGLQGLASVPTTPKRRSSRSSSNQTLELMKQQLLVQQAHMRHLQTMRSKSKDPTAISPANTFKKHCGKIKVGGAGRVRIRRRSTGGSFDDYENCSEVSGDTVNTEESGVGKRGRRVKDLSLDTSHGVSQSLIGISPQAQPELVFTPPNTDDNGITDVQSSRTALQAALRMSEQLDVIISQLQRQEGVISMQHRLLQQKDAQLTAVIAAQSSSSSLLSEQRGSIKLQVNIEKANSSTASSFLAESGRQASMEHKVTHVDI